MSHHSSTCIPHLGWYVRRAPPRAAPPRPIACETLPTQRDIVRPWRDILHHWQARKSEPAPKSGARGSAVSRTMRMWATVARWLRGLPRSQ